MNETRKAALAVAAHATGPDDCRILLDMLGLLAQPPMPKRKPGRPRIDHGHGDYRTYGKGCRCADCREAHRVRCAKQRAARAKNPAAADRAGHGKASTYKNYKCRCTACSKANTARVVAYKARRRKRVAA